MALAAAERGWLDSDALWAAGARCGRLGAESTVESVFAGLLDDSRVGELSDALLDGDGVARAMLPYAATVAQVDFGGEIDTEDPARGASGEAFLARYELGPVLGEGGVGRVCAAKDRSVGRTVALKTLRHGVYTGRRDLERFLQEARITGQLEHPGIIPIHDMGSLPDGQPYYTMRVVKQRSLRHVLGDRTRSPEWTLFRLVTAFGQVCRAIAYAHARGVVHRDLKPENVLVGDYGEVYVADWGIAKILGESSVSPYAASTDAASSATLSGAVLGTVGYLSPEQARGEIERLGPKSDLYSLGAVLYELLTGRPPFHGPVATVLADTLDVVPARPRTLRLDCPLVLDELCMALLSKRPEDRPASADEVAQEVEDFLEGAKEKARRRSEGERLVARARTEVGRHEAARADRDRWLSEARSSLDGVKPWEGADAKRAGWALEDRADAAQREESHALAAAVNDYGSALAFDPESADARNGLAALHWSRLERMEQEADPSGCAYYETLVRQYDDGRYAARLASEGRVSIESDPPGATVVAWRFVEHDRVLRAAEPRSLGTTPVREARLPPGSYVLVLRHDGYRDVRYPIVCRRGELHAARVNLYTDVEIGEGRVYVPGGTFALGGDGDALDGLAREPVDVADFAMDRLPVTFTEYLAFLEALDARDPAEGARRSPCTTESADGAAATRGASGRWAPRFAMIVEGGDARRYCGPHEVGRVPVFAIDWFDARAYAAWRAEREGVACRLPTEAEWEKAARGVDGRKFPWGDRFDASFSKMRDSRPGFAQPEPVGAFPIDESVYGVRDLGGGMRCWVADVHGESALEDALRAPEPAPGTTREDGGLSMSRGGHWFATDAACRSASRFRFFSLLRNAGIGVRLVRPLGRR